ncbi:NIPA8 [Hepatospora eriocheir]|uniref:NIPA8 n=1 Tax=Hepatospora eriocheir TaxID=1081669 RepID=A0A1X0Q9X6_9MICR|nr:NIPA8 [Hepatospora eriocheir]
MKIDLLNMGKEFKDKPCSTDSDCRFSAVGDYNSLYCVESKCRPLKKPGSSCTSPFDCSSYMFYGPLACSDSCKKGKECHNSVIEYTKFCCRGIPRERDCDITRPGGLSGCNTSQICELVGGKPKCVDRREKSWLLGMILSILGNILINIGINLMKRSYKQAYLNIVICYMPTMLLGEMVYALGKFSGYASYIFGNQSLLAGLSATGLVSNSIFAPIINDEIFTWKDGAAIILVFVGSTFIVSNTSRTHTIYTLCELLKMYFRRATVLWFAFIILVIIILFFFIKYIEVNSDWSLIDDPFQFMQTSQYFEADGIICKYFMVVAYVGLSSFIAAYSTLSAKSLGEIIDKTLGGDNQFKYFISYFFIITLTMCTIGQIYWLNRALKHFDALLVIPIFHIFWTMLSILTAGIYFQDFDNYSYKQLRNFIVGVFIIFCGSIFLGFRIVNKNAVESHLLYNQNENRNE